VIESSTRFSSEHRVCSSNIDVILIALPSMVESMWKSSAHTTFGARASTGGTQSVYVGCAPAPAHGYPQAEAVDIGWTSKREANRRHPASPNSDARQIKPEHTPDSVDQKSWQAALDSVEM
jgi:hypothetical protein